MRTECEQAREWMDLLLENELKQPEKEQLDRHLESCKSCRMMLAEEQSLIQGLRNLKKVPCPDAVIQSILRMTKPERRSWFKRITQAVLQPAFRKPAYAFAGVLAAALLFWLIPKMEMQDTGSELALQETVDSQDLEKSKAQAEWTLLYVSKKLNQAQEKAVKDVVIQDLPETLKNTIKKTVPFFKGGRI
ncbi:zf-HC2 domain-containing protein [bacterium]|nr:zf-HC2 domain-containing protein [bacterium]